MIDTLHLNRPLDSWKQFDQLTDKLDQAKVQQDIEKEGPPCVTGHLDNLRVRVDPGWVWIKGSISKWHLGDNQQRLTRKGTEDAVKHLSDDLGLDLAPAKITRLDLGATLIVRKLVSEYLSFMGECTRMNRGNWSGVNGPSVYYQNGQRQFVLYDKKAEVMQKKKPINAVYKGQNLLRLELRLTRRVAKQLDREKLLVQDIFQEQCYISLLKKFISQYQQVRKLKTLSIKEGMAMENTKQLLQQLTLVGLKQLGGEQPLVELLKSEKDAGRLDRQQFHRMKSKLHQLTADPQVIDNGDQMTDLIEEINTKVQRAISSYR